MTKLSRPMLGFASVVIVALCFLPSLVLAQGTKLGEARAAASEDDEQKNLEEIRKVSGRLGTLIEKATILLKDIAECKDALQCGAKIDELFINMRTEVLNVLDKLGSNSELMDAVARAKERIIILKDWYASQPPEYPQGEATSKDLAEQIANLGQAVEGIRGTRVMAQEQLRVLMLQQQVTRDLFIRKKVRAGVEAVQAVVGELGNLSKALDTVANINFRSTGRLAN